MERKRNICRTHAAAYKHTLVTSQARIQSKQADSLLHSYAHRLPPQQAAQHSKLSLNTVYLYYDHIRDRLIATRYYTDGALSFEEMGLAPEVISALKQRRGIRQNDIYQHSAELIEWAEEWPPHLTLRHLRQIFVLSGPIDQPAPLSTAELAKLNAYIRYARTELIVDRRKTNVANGITNQESGAESLKKAWTAYRSASKRVERER